MTTVTYYVCDICKRSHRSKSAAEECEAQGLPPQYPIGLMSAEGDGKDRLAFALAEQIREGHWLADVRWACRDNGCGDSLGDQRCGGGGFYHSVPFNPAWLDWPSFHRLRNWLDSQGITPTVFVDGQAVRLEHVERVEREEAAIAKAEARP